MPSEKHRATRDEAMADEETSQSRATFKRQQIYWKLPPRRDTGGSSTATAGERSQNTRGRNDNIYPLSSQREPDIYSCVTDDAITLLALFATTFICYIAYIDSSARECLPAKQALPFSNPTNDILSSEEY